MTALAATAATVGAGSATGSLIISMSIALFLMGPLGGLMIDMLKIMMRLALIGLVLNLLPFNFVNVWSNDALTWLGIPMPVAPGLAVVAIYALSTINLPLPAKIERWMRIAIYIIGGSATAGAPAWIALSKSIGGLMWDIFTLFTSLLGIVSGWLMKK